MRRHRYVVVMARKPVLGKVKTRLAVSIGRSAALAFYAGVLRRTLRRLGRDRRWKTIVAVTPSGEAARPGLWTRHLPVVAQRGRDLGERMQAALDTLPAGPVVVVGSDIPDLAPGHIAAAFRALKRHDAVFGPADDGGYWLIGVAGGARGMRLFGSVRWSTEHALADTIRGLPPATRVAMVHTLPDIDTGDDLRRWSRSKTHEDP